MSTQVTVTKSLDCYRFYLSVYCVIYNVEIHKPTMPFGSGRKKVEEKNSVSPVAGVNKSTL